LLDARETLARFMVDGLPDAALFDEVVGGLVARARTHGCHAPLRAYGEMVDMLWRDGNPRAAIRLEELWNDLGKRHSFALLCGYLMDNFVAEAHGEGFQRVCDTHTHVLPSLAVEGTPEALLREVSSWQQRARALGNELEHRKTLEAALREALFERRRVEEQLRAQNDELARTVRFSETFVGILGHDLRNPLSAVTTAASLLVRRADSERMARPAARILSSGQRMGRMIDQLLDFTRIRLGQGVPITRARVDVAEICRVVVEERGEEARRVRLDVAGDAVGFWDGDRLSQLLANLVGNGLAHGDREGSVLVHVDGTDAATVRLAVRNAGVIPAAILPGLFEPSKPTSANIKREGSSGLGLGLYISREIAVAHGGAIDLSSSPDEGTCFVVTLPRDGDQARVAFGEPS
jgi:signal transduction histidine kinase